MLLLLDILSSSVVTAGDSVASPLAGVTATSAATVGKLQPKSKIRESTTTASSQPEHPHQGKVTPFQPGDPKIELDDKALEILARGQPYQTQISLPGSSGGRGMVVQDVNAPAHIVWERILDYDNYAKMVPKTIESQNYEIVDHALDGDDNNQEEATSTTTSQTQTLEAEGSSTATLSPPAKTIYTRMKIGFPMLTLTFYVKHLYYPELNSLTWTLDYSRKSDLDDSCGYWYVVPLSPTQSRVFYAVELSIFDWVPSFVVHFLKNKALTDATAWVKKYSEIEHGKLQTKQQQQQEEESASAQAAVAAQLEQQQHQTEQDAAGGHDPVEVAATGDASKESTANVPFWRGWFGLNKSTPPSQPEPEEVTTEEPPTADDESCASVTSTELSDDANEGEVEGEQGRSSNEETTALATNAKPGSDNEVVKARPSPVGLTRYALVASVFALSLYNVHLYFSS